MRAWILVLVLLGFSASVVSAEEAAWRTAARKLPGNVEGVLRAARSADLVAAEEATVHRLLAHAYYQRGRFDDCYLHAESALALVPPAMDAGPVELELRRLCSEAALRSGHIERSESHAVRLGFAANAETPGGRKALADALDRLLEASLWRGALSEANDVGAAIRDVAIEEGKGIFAPRPLIRYASLLVDLGHFVPALRILDEVDVRLPDEGADRERGLSKLARTRASRRMGNPTGARSQMREARRFIQILDDSELFARLAMEEVLTRIESDPPRPDVAARWVESYLKRRRDDMQPDRIWDRRLWTMLGVARDLAGDREGALKAWKKGIVGNEREGPLSMTEARGFLSCATYLHEDRNDKDAVAIARRADMFLAQFAKFQHGRAGLSYAAEVQRRIAQSMRDEDAASDFERRDASGDVLAREHLAAAEKAVAEKRDDDAEQLFWRAFRCAPWSADAARRALWFLFRTRRSESMKRLVDAARVAGHSSRALFVGGFLDLGARHGDGALAKFGRLELTGARSERSPRFPLSLSATLIREPGIALHVINGDPGWSGGEWEIEPPRRALALRWMAKSYLSLGHPAKARRLLRRTEAAGLDLAGVQEIEWETAFLEGNLDATRRHIGLVIDRPDQKEKETPRWFRAVLEMELGNWTKALADWESSIDVKPDQVSVVAAWICARASGNRESEARWSEWLIGRKTHWGAFAAGKIDGASMNRGLLHASLAGETGLAWDFFLLGVARLESADKAGAAFCLRQAIARARDEVAVRAAAWRMLRRR